MTNAQGESTSITVVVLTSNEQGDLPGLLTSIPKTWDTLVIDGGSYDQTLPIAHSHGAQIIEQDAQAIEEAHGNFDIARNRAAGSTNAEWLLYLDADERLTAELTAEITARLAEPTQHNAFSIPRHNLFWGRPGRLLGEDRQTRLVRRGYGQYEGVDLHRQIQVRGTVGALQQPMIHHNVASAKDIVKRFVRYVPQQARTQERRPGLGQIFREPFGLFRYYYIKNQAWKDGLRGLAMSLFYSLEHGATLLLSWIHRSALCSKRL